MNRQDAGIRPSDGFGKVLSASDHRQDTPAGGNQLPAAHRRAGVVHRHTGDALGLIDAGDWLSGFRRLGVATGRDDDADDAVAADLTGGLTQPTFSGGEKDWRKRLIDKRQDDLRLGQINSVAALLLHDSGQAAGKINSMTDH